MATKLFFRDLGDLFAPYPFMWSLGTNSARLTGATVGWQGNPLSTWAGTNTVVSTATTVAGLTNGVEVGNGASFLHWISAPLDRDVTISGTVTLNLWAAENNMSANAAINAVIERVDSQGAIASTIANTARVTELGTSIAVANFTVTPTSTNMLKGDRIRVRVYADDAGTMAASFTVSFDFNGPSGGADGDSFVSFTETFDFLTNDPGDQLQEYTSGPVVDIGRVVTAARRAQGFKVPFASTLTSVELFLSRFGSPADNFEVALQADSAGAPSNVDLATASMAASSISTSSTYYTFDLADTALTASTLYWIVARRSGAIDGANYILIDGTASNSYLPAQFVNYDSSVPTWSGGFDTADFTFRVHVASTALYLTTTTSDIDPGGGSTDTKEAWTSRGSGTTDAVRNTVTGWTAPLQATVTAGGNAVEWFTKGLTAFTLSAPVIANVWAFDNASLAVTSRVELAVCANDGSSAVVWAATTYPTEVLSSPGSALPMYLAGDDLAVTNGQRLRIRVYLDDISTTAMNNAGSYTLTYAGTSAGARGDTYLTMGQVLTEFVTAAVLPSLAMGPRLPA